jgi:hypothetical protein
MPPPDDDRRHPRDADGPGLDAGYPVSNELLALEYGGRRLAFAPNATGDRFVDVLDRLVPGSYDSPHEVRSGIGTDGTPDVAIIREESTVLPGDELVDRRQWTSAEDADRE